MFIPLIFSCSEDDSCEPAPKLTTNPAENITDVSANISGTITPPTCEDTVTSQGFVYGDENLPTVDDNKIIKSGSSISASLTNLNQNTTYYFRTFFENPTGIFYGNESSFSTSVGAIEFNSSNYSNVTPISATVSFSINSLGGGNISESGIVYSSNSNPNVDDDNKVVSNKNNASIDLDNLSPDTTYYFRPYATNESGMFYGAEMSFTTTDGDVKLDVSLLRISQTFFDFTVNVSDDGGWDNLLTSSGIYFSSTNNYENGVKRTEPSARISSLNSDSSYFVFPFYIANGKEYVLDAIELKTAPDNINAEIRRFELILEFPVYGNTGCAPQIVSCRCDHYYNTGMDADVWIDTDTKYIREGIVWIYSYESTERGSFFVNEGSVAGSGISVNTDSTGTYFNEIGKGSLSNERMFVTKEDGSCVNPYKVRVVIKDWAGNVFTSEFIDIVVPPLP